MSSSILPKIGCKHSSILNSYFSKIERVGIDLLNVELKETRTDSYKIKKSDLDSDFIVFLNHKLERFYICKSNSFSFSVKENHFRHSAILKRTIYSCKMSDYDLFYEIMNKILIDKSYIKKCFRKD